MKHKGEPVRLMSGEHGTVIVADGDVYPEWFTPPGAAEVSADETEPDEESD